MTRIETNRRFTAILAATLAWVSCASAHGTPHGAVLSLSAVRNAGDRFDAKATSWVDGSDLGRAGQLMNYDQPTWVGTGKSGDPYCLRLDGQGNCVTVPSGAEIDPASGFAIEVLARVRQKSLSREEMAPFLAVGGMSSSGDFNLQVRSGGRDDSLYLNTQFRGTGY